MAYSNILTGLPTGGVVVPGVTKVVGQDGAVHIIAPPLAAYGRTDYPEVALTTFPALNTWTFMSGDSVVSVPLTFDTTKYASVLFQVFVDSMMVAANTTSAVTGRVDVKFQYQFNTVTAGVDNASWLEMHNEITFAADSEASIGAASVPYFSALGAMANTLNSPSFAKQKLLTAAALGTGWQFSIRRMLRIVTAAPYSLAVRGGSIHYQGIQTA